MTDVRRPLYVHVGTETFNHLSVCRVIVAARELRKCVQREGKYGGQTLTRRGNSLDTLSTILKSELDRIPGSASLRNDGGHD